MYTKGAFKKTFNTVSVTSSIVAENVTKVKKIIHTTNNLFRQITPGLASLELFACGNQVPDHIGTDEVVEISGKNIGIPLLEPQIQSRIRHLWEMYARQTDAVASYSLKSLSACLERYYGKRVIILPDEYDTPMQEAYVNGYWGAQL